MKLRIAELTAHTVTRSRGGMAYDSLKPHLERNQTVVIDVGGEQPVSLSFLDELIRRLGESGHLTQVTFLVHEKDALRKLSRIAKIREVQINYADGETGTRRKVRRAPSPSHEVSGTRVKPPAAADAMSRR
jgi:hypothetical protein